MKDRVEENRENKVKKEKDEIQITVTLDCERSLSEHLDKVNLNFDIGRVTRKHLAVYLIEKGLKEFSELDIKAVRESVLTDLLLLDHLYRQAKESGVVPDALKEILWRSISLSGSIKKNKKTTQPRYSNAIPKEEEVA